MKIYIAGPITGVPDYADRFNKYRKLVREVAPYSEIICPHDFVPSDADWHDAIDMCINVLCQCDMIIMMPGWESSQGATVEHDFAKDNNIIVLSELIKQLDNY